MRVQAAPPEHYAWIAQRARLTIGPDFRAIEALRSDGSIAGMVAFGGWTPNSVCMHVALETPTAARVLLRPAFGIAFVEFKREVIIGQVLSTNQRALDLDRHLGFSEVARLKDAWEPGVDIIVLEMRRENCRWIPLTRKAA